MAEAWAAAEGGSHVHKVKVTALGDGLSGGGDTGIKGDPLVSGLGDWVLGGWGWLSPRRGALRLWSWGWEEDTVSEIPVR